MEKLRYKLAGFMYGRNGADSLYKAQAAGYIVLALINIFARSAVVSVIMWALFIWSMFRFFSKNLNKRREENRAFLSAAAKVKQFFVLRKNMLRDIKTHVYKKCPQCHKMLRLPRKKGEHTVNCPCCHNSFSVKIR
ncbi:MAG: hypothetical protein ACI4JJ_02465 [Huintestinicola sp.]